MLSLVMSAIEDPDARDFFTGIFQQYHRLMFYEASKYLSDQNAKEDVVQNALVKAIEHIDAVMQLEPVKIPAYLVIITRNESINYLRHESVVSSHASDVELESLSEDSAADDLLFVLDRKLTLEHVWTKLSEPEQTLLSGRYLIGYSDEELAALLGCKAASIRMMLTRARRRAARILKEEGITDAN